MFQQLTEENLCPLNLIRFDWWLHSGSVSSWRGPRMDLDESPSKRVNQSRHAEDEFTSHTG